MACCLIIGRQADLTAVTESRDLAEVEKQKLSAERITLMRDVRALQERLHSAEALNQSHETKIAEQKDHINKLMAECKQVAI